MLAKLISPLAFSIQPFLCREWLFQFGKDDHAGTGLEQALNLGIDLLSDQRLGVIHYDHSAIGKIADALAFVFAFTHDPQREDLARQEHRAHGFGKLVQVDVIDGLQLRDFAEVVIVGVELGAEVASQSNQLAVNFFFVGEIAVVDFDFVARIALDAVEHFEAVTSTSPFDGVRRVGDLLKLIQNKTRNNNEALDEIGFDEVGDAAIDNGASVQEQQVVRFILRGEADVGNDQGKIFFVAAHGQDDADVAEAKKQ